MTVPTPHRGVPMDAVPSTVSSLTDLARLAIDTTDDLIGVFDHKQLWGFNNAAFQSVLGHAPELLRGAALLDLVYPEDVVAMQHCLDESGFLRQSRTVEARLLHITGTPRWFEATVHWNDAAGAARYGVFVARDIAHRKKWETEIQHLAAFPRFNPNPVFALSSDGVLIYYNEAAMAMAQRLGHQQPSAILPLNCTNIVKVSLATGQTNLRLETQLSGRTLAWSFYPIQASQVVHCYAEDITDRLSLEAQLRQSQKMESVGQLASGVAHDFNNILTIIQGHSSLLLGVCEQDAALTDSLKQVAAAAERGANLTRQLLMFSRKQLLQPQLLDFNEVIQNMTKMLRVLLGEAVKLVINLEPNLPAIHADAGMLEQVVMNLAVNARDAMPQGGDLRLNTSRCEVDAEFCEQHPEARPGHFVCLDVTDTGCGMDPGTLHRIFEPFFTTKAPGKGTGLGLATVYGIVKQHNGWLQVTSMVQQGTRFRIFLPVSSKSAAEPLHDRAVTVRGGSETILVVEDEPALRELVIEILQRYGYRVLEASHGQEAMDIWAQNYQHIDLVLTDIVMPHGVSGRDLAERILQENPAMKVIYTSGYPVDVLGADFSGKPAVAFLQKPYQPQTLAQLVRDCLDAPAN